MSFRICRRSVFVFALFALFALAETQAATTIVDVVPARYYGEAEQNSEPSIAVNPSNPNQVLITAFGNTSARNPVYFSSNGGATWTVSWNIATSDTSLAWPAGGDAYLAQTTANGAILFARRFVPHPTRTNVVYLQYLARSLYRPGGDGPDQPWVAAARVSGTDRIYVAFNDLSQPERTASVRSSLDGGATWKTTLVEQVVPGAQQDGSAVRVAVSGDAVYVAFQRWNAMLGDGDAQGDLVVVKDGAGGTNDFSDLGAAGVVALSNGVFPQSNLGQERLGSDLTLAIDPADANHVFLATAILNNGGLPIITVLESTDGGAHWIRVFNTAANTALPALAIAANGTVGLLYTQLAGGNLETHLTQSANGFGSVSDETLSRFTDNAPPVRFNPYIGDYQSLVAVGNKFYGVFSASNDTSLFPQPVTLQRNPSLLGNRVAFSIDPFFFSSDAISGP